MDTLTILNGSNKLEIGPRNGEYLDILFSSQNVKVSTKSYLYRDAEELSTFFKSLAANWKGWEGCKTWHSIESDIHFEAIHNNLGAIILKFQIQQDQTSNPWAFKGQISIELGMLQSISENAEKIFTS